MADGWNLARQPRHSPGCGVAARRGDLRSGARTNKAEPCSRNHLLRHHASHQPYAYLSPVAKIFTYIIMDHVPQPPDCNPPEINVPILCLDGEYRFSYDDLDYKTFPKRSGYVVDSRGNILEDDIARQPWPKTLSMLQACYKHGCISAFSKGHTVTNSVKKTSYGNLQLHCSSIRRNFQTFCNVESSSSSKFR